MPCQLLIDGLGSDLGATIRQAPLFGVPANTDLVLVLCPYVSVVERALRELPMAVQVIVVAPPWSQVVAAAQSAIAEVVAAEDGVPGRQAQLRRRLAEVACAFPELRDELEDVLWRK